MTVRQRMHVALRLALIGLMSGASTYVAFSRAVETRRDHAPETAPAGLRAAPGFTVRAGLLSIYNSSLTSDVQLAGTRYRVPTDFAPFDASRAKATSVQDPI